MSRRQTSLIVTQTAPEAPSRCSAHEHPSVDQSLPDEPGVDPRQPEEHEGTGREPTPTFVVDVGEARRTPPDVRTRCSIVQAQRQQAGELLAVEVVWQHHLESRLTTHRGPIR